MSMRDYAVNDYGLLITADAMELLAKAICPGYTPAAYQKNSYDFQDTVAAKLDLIYTGDFTGEAIYINDNGDDEYSHALDFSNDSLYYITLNRYPSLFRQAYRDMNQVIQELKLRLGDYLPANFDFRNNIRHFIGTYYG